MNCELISLIVPCYKTPRFQITNCIRSLVSQTYEELEIIVVDDGSGEEYRTLLQEIEKIDKRIKIYYKSNNEGLSATRNYGLKKASGDYVLFIDSDDMIHPSSIYNMLYIIRNTNSDMVIGEVAVITDYESAFHCQNKQNEYEELDGLTALDRMIKNDGFGSTACGRLAKKTTWNRHGEDPFINGVLHEDLASMWEIISNCSKVCFLRGQYYYYYQGGESNIHTRLVSDKFCKDFYTALVNRNQSLSAIYPELKQSIAYSYITNIPMIYNYTYETNKPKEFNQLRRSMRKLFRENYKVGINGVGNNITKRLRYGLFLLFPKVYICTYKAVRRKKGLRI